MTIKEWGEKRDDLRVTLCGCMIGLSNFLTKSGRKPDSDDLFIDGVLRDVAEYQAAAEKLDNEFLLTKEGA